MQFKNINSICYFKTVPPSGIVRMSGFGQFGFEPDGVNDYASITAGALALLTAEGSDIGLNATHKAFLQTVVDDTLAGSTARKQLTFSIEPTNLTDPYGFLLANMNWVAAMAQQLKAGQDQVAAGGKRLDIVIRFASEMNDHPGTSSYSSQPVAYVRTWRAVRQVFRTEAPDIKFSFSPALRVDINEANLDAYWPGDGVVDVLAGTWYVGSSADFVGSAKTMTDYVLRRAGVGLPFGICELAGFDDVTGTNTPMVRRMVDTISGLGVPFDYVTMFLGPAGDGRKNWGGSMDFSFLNPHASRN